MAKIIPAEVYCIFKMGPLEMKGLKGAGVRDLIAVTAVKETTLKIPFLWDQIICCGPEPPLLRELNSKRGIVISQTMAILDLLGKYFKDGVPLAHVMFEKKWKPHSRRSSLFVPVS